MCSAIRAHVLAALSQGSGRRGGVYLTFFQKTLLAARILIFVTFLHMLSLLFPVLSCAHFITLPTHSRRPKVGAHCKSVRTSNTSQHGSGARIRASDGREARRRACCRQSTHSQTRHHQRRAVEQQATRVRGRVRRVHGRFIGESDGRGKAKAAVGIVLVLDREVCATSDGQSSDPLAFIDAFSKVIAALEKDDWMSFSAVWRRHSLEERRHEFLRRCPNLITAAFCPSCRVILGILNQLFDEMSADLYALEEEELDRNTNNRLFFKPRLKKSLS